MPSRSIRADGEDDLTTRVLLVDESQVFLKAAADFVQRQEDLVLIGAYASGEEALDEAGALGPDVALIGDSARGLKTMSRLREMIPAVGIIALTTCDGVVYRRAVIAAGADDLVRRAVLTTALIPAIRRMMQA